MTEVKNSRKLLFGKTLFIASIATVLTTLLLVFITGLASHRTILDNALISLSIIGVITFLFLTAGLYFGVDIQDNLSDKLNFNWKGSGLSDNAHLVPDGPVSFDVGEDFAGIVVSIFLWIAVSILFILFLILMEFVVWFAAMALAGLVYWIFIRAMKLIFSKSAYCQGDLPKSISYGFTYTALYVGWIYGVIFISTVF